MTDRMDVSRVLLEMRAMKSQMQAFGGGAAAKDVAATSVNAPGLQPQKVNGPRFGELFETAVNKVNEIQQTSGNTTKAYLQGDKSVDVVDVMVASQKSSVAFESAVQVRNKFVEAYRDVMNMPI